MGADPEHASGEIKRLQRCINDLVTLLALPAIWSGGDPSQVLDTLLGALMRMLSLDLVAVRLKVPGGEAPIEIVRISKSRGPMPPTHEICEALSQSLGATHGNGHRCCERFLVREMFRSCLFHWGCRANSA